MNSKFKKSFDGTPALIRERIFDGNVIVFVVKLSEISSIDHSKIDFDKASDTILKKESGSSDKRIFYEWHNGSGFSKGDPDRQSLYNF